MSLCCLVQMEETNKREKDKCSTQDTLTIC
jgi:hypothetical protein